MNKIKAVIFDMDGVLIDAKEWHFEALNRALNLFGMEISRYDHLVAYDGLPTKKKLEMLTLERGLPAALHDFINEMKQQFTLELIFSHCKPTFHHEYCLAELKRSGYHLAVCSNSIRQTMDYMLSKANLLPLLDFYLSNQDVEKAKPDPEMYIKAIERLKLDPQECLIVEDNFNGIKAALASGAHVLEVKNIDEVNLTNLQWKISQLEASHA